MSIAGRLRELLRERLGALVDGDTTLDDLADEEERSVHRARSSRAARTGRRAAQETRPSAPPRPERPEPPDPQRLAQLYAILEAPPGADLHVVRQSYRRLLRQHHPDIVGPAGSAERVQLLVEAYAELARLLGLR